MGGAKGPDELQQLQFEAVNRVWSDAIADVPYYANLVSQGLAPATIRCGGDFRAIPITTRQALQDEPRAFLRRSGSPDGFVHTAGSTGTPLHVGMNDSERDLMRIVKLASWQEFGYTPSSRLYLIWGHAHLLGAGWRGQLNQFKRRVADEFLGYRRVDAYWLNRAKCRAMAEDLIRVRPIGLIGYAAALDLFARHTVDFKDRFRSLKLGFVLATTEAPPRIDTMANLEDLFGCPVIQEYGGGEFGQVALKRADAPYEVYSDLNYVECERPATDEPLIYPALLTSLYPRYVPLIRYRNGDGLFDPQILPHGHVQRFGAVAGRLTDVVALDNGDSIHSLSIFHCVHEEPDVYNVQMRMDDSGIDVRLVVAPGTDRPALEARVRGRLTQVHPSLAKVRFVYLEDLETNRAGKRRWLVDDRTRSCVESQAS